MGKMLLLRKDRSRSERNKTTTGKEVIIILNQKIYSLSCFEEKLKFRDMLEVKPESR